MGAKKELTVSENPEADSTTSNSIYQSAEMLSKFATATSSSLYQSAENVATTTSNSIYQSTEGLSEFATSTSHSFYQFVPGLQTTERLSGVLSSAFDASAWATSTS